MNYFEKHIGDYIRDTVSLTMLEDGAYNRLIDQMYQSERALPLDKKMVYRLARATSSAERKAVDFVLDTFFKASEDGYEQKRIRAEIERYQEKQRKAKASADARWNKSKPNANASQTHDAPDMRTHSEGNAHQTPDTRHQTPDLKPRADDDTTDSGYEHVAEAPLPERQDPPAGDDNPAIALTVKLRSWGVNATFTMPAVQDWSTRQVSHDILAQAVALAREQKGPAAKIAPNYLVPIVEKLLAQQAMPIPAAQPKPKADDWAWKRSNPGIDAKGRELGMFARGGESYPDFAARIQIAIDKRKGQP
jgi:uncharacterized protein YdaU (DUF1376 family)